MTWGIVSADSGDRCILQCARHKRGARCAAGLECGAGTIIGSHRIMSIADLRQEYGYAELVEDDAAADPFRQFARWFDDALRAELPLPNAMTLATADADGRPSARVVLLKGADADGFVFYTNYESRKARELAANPYASLVFLWTPMERQVRIEGTVEKVSDAESDEY